MARPTRTLRQPAAASLAELIDPSFENDWLREAVGRFLLSDSPLESESGDKLRSEGGVMRPTRTLPARSAQR